MGMRIIVQQSPSVGVTVEGRVGLRGPVCRGENVRLALETKNFKYKEVTLFYTRMEMKSKEERVKEGITILKKLRGVGIPPMNFGIQTVQKKISEWVNSGSAIKEIISIPNYDRDAHLTLPQQKGQTAELVLRQIPT